MAEGESPKVPSLAEQYVLSKDAKNVEVPSVESATVAVPEEAVKESDSDILPTAADESVGATEESVKTRPVIEEVSEETKVNEPEGTPEVIEATSEEINGTADDENTGDQEGAAEETPEIKLETAPADFRFPTTNQTRHCFTRYVEYHRCVAAKGDGAPECDKFAKYYRSLCPGEWVDKWNEQRENGTFPGRI